MTSFRAWTTRVSNPVCSPRFRASASVLIQEAAFATGVPPDLYAFHRYTWNSTSLYQTLAAQYRMPFPGQAQGFHIRLTKPPTLALRPVIPINACTLSITAAAGTELAGAYSLGTVKARKLLTPSFSFPIKVLYNPQAFFTHAALLDQACAHCPIFPTAASRRSLGRVSVPVWLIILSNQLRIVALVSFYLTN